MFGRTLVLAAAMAGLLHAQEGPTKGRTWEGYGKGISWKTSVAEALEAAADTKRPVLYFELVGDLDKEGC